MQTSDILILMPLQVCGATEVQGLEATEVQGLEATEVLGLEATDHRLRGSLPLY